MVKIDIPPNSPFSLANIPFGVISTKSNPAPRCATAIGSYALDLSSHAEEGHLAGRSYEIDLRTIFSHRSLNTFAALPQDLRQRVRHRIIEDVQSERVSEKSLVKLDEVIMHLPMKIGGYSDFYCSLEHMQNCTPTGGGGVASSIPPNWFHAPSVYNGRVSSIVPSGTPIRRPKGVFFDQTIGSGPATGGPHDVKVTYGPTRELDFELEMGYFVSKPVPFGDDVSIGDADQHIFGFVLLNDWSARDLQIFEIRPLGPFHGKGFGTSISPWIVTMDALEPYRCAPKQHPDRPDILPLYKFPSEKEAGKGTVDIRLRVRITRKTTGKEVVFATSNLKYMYWTPLQQLVHHASAGCGLETGDVMGTGTISGDAVDRKGGKRELGCLYEATHRGADMVPLQDGTEMRYLDDGDEVVLEGWCGGDEHSASGMGIGFGECRGIILPAK